MKLAAYGFSALIWTRSLLSSWTQTVSFNGSFSYCAIDAVQCPPGSNALFCAMFADDSTVYMPSNSVDEFSLKMKWNWWLTKNNLILNVSKAKCIVFALRRENQLYISSKGSWIKQVTEAKLLGVTIDGQLSWHNHVDKIIGKMGKRNNYKRWSSLLTPSASLQVIQALVLFHLVYCPAVWSGAANKELHTLQLVQDRAACLALRTKCTLVFLAESGRWFKNNPTACTHG